MEVRHFCSWFTQSSSNSHNFFVSTLNWAPFEVMDSWLPKIWNEIWYAWNGLQKVLRNVSNRGAAATFPSWCVRWRILRCGDFATISQLRNEGMRLRNGTHVPRGGFAAAKIFAEGGMGLRNHFAEKWRFRRGLFLAAKFRRPLHFHAFELLLAPWGLPSISLHFLLN